MRLVRALGAVVAVVLAALWAWLVVEAVTDPDVPNPWIGAWIGFGLSSLVGIPALLGLAAAALRVWRATWRAVAGLVASALTAAVFWVFCVLILGSS